MQPARRGRNTPTTSTGAHGPLAARTSARCTMAGSASAASGVYFHASGSARMSSAAIAILTSDDSRSCDSRLPNGVVPTISVANGRGGSATSSMVPEMSGGSGSPSSIGRRAWPFCDMSSATLISDPVRCNAAAISSPLVPQCSPSKRLRTSRMARRCELVCASKARSHSVSVPIERLLRLAEPTRSRRSSTTKTFEWIIVLAVRAPSVTSG